MLLRNKIFSYVFVLLSTNLLLAKTLQLTGSSTIAPLANEIAKKYEKEHNIKVQVQTGGSTRGIVDQLRGLNDIGMSSRELKSSESTRLTSFPIALDALAVITHKSNPINNITRNALINIYQKKNRKWKNDKNITVINKAAGRGTLDTFLNFLKIKNRSIKADTIIGDNAQAVKIVSKNSNAIAYVSLANALEAIKNKLPIKIIDVNHIKATQKNIQDRSYPLIRELHLVIKKSQINNPSLLEFIFYFNKETSKQVISTLQYTPTHVAQKQL